MPHKIIILNYDYIISYLYIIIINMFKCNFTFAEIHKYGNFWTLGKIFFTFIIFKNIYFLVIISFVKSRFLKKLILYKIVFTDQLNKNGRLTITIFILLGGVWKNDFGYSRRKKQSLLEKSGVRACVLEGATSTTMIQVDGGPPCEWRLAKQRVLGSVRPTAFH